VLGLLGYAAGALAMTLLIAAVLGLLASVGMKRLPDLKPSAAAEGLMLG
jgi:hypothetical protein